MWQPTAILFPDVELWATTYLRAALNERDEDYVWNVYVSNAVPSSRRDRMVIVRRDGGLSDGLRDNARLSVRVWAKKEQEATDLARLVQALLWAAPDGNPILSVVQQSGPTPIPDESKSALRYLVFEVATRGTALTEGA